MRRYQLWWVISGVKVGWVVTQLPFEIHFVLKVRAVEVENPDGSRVEKQILDAQGLELHHVVL